MNTYWVKYWTKDGKPTGVQVQAYNALDAKMVVEGYPNFGTLMEYPKEVKQ